MERLHLNQRKKRRYSSFAGNFDIDTQKMEKSDFITQNLISTSAELSKLIWAELNGV